MSYVLVADDERDIRSLTRLLLELAGHRVVEAPDGSAALDLLNAESEIDVLLLDLRLPERDGWEVIAALRESGRLPKLRVIIFSAQLDPRDMSRARGEGAATCLVKPFTEEDLLAAVEA